MVNDYIVHNVNPNSDSNYIWLGDQLLRPIAFLGRQWMELECSDSRIQRVVLKPFLALAIALSGIPAVIGSLIKVLKAESSDYDFITPRVPGIMARFGVRGNDSVAISDHFRKIIPPEVFDQIFVHQIDHAFENGEEEPKVPTCLITLIRSNSLIHRIKATLKLSFANASACDVDGAVKDFLKRFNSLLVEAPRNPEHERLWETAKLTSRVYLFVNKDLSQMRIRAGFF